MSADKDYSQYCCEVAQFYHSDGCIYKATPPQTVRQLAMVEYTHA